MTTSTTKTTCALALMLMSTATGCGGGKALSPSATSRDYASPTGRSSSPAFDEARGGEGPVARYEPGSPSQGSMGATSAAPANRAEGSWWGPSKSADATSDSRSMPRPEERPGLGTEWGEVRYSAVHEESFTRMDGDTPFSLGDFRYDDVSGVRNMVGYGNEGRGSARLTLAGGAVTVALRDAGGSDLPGIARGDRTYVVGRAGDRYTIALQNRTRYRFEIVATVDGLDVVNGKTGSYGNRGYVLDPYTSFEIEGFRKSETEVAAFRFGRVADSYAAEKGDARNVGVVGVAVFADKSMPRYRFDPWNDGVTRDRADPFPANPSRDGRFAEPPRGRW
ncbi:MAG: hypothetical protein U0169_07370 [Polyangiaceae bacterium]